MLAGCDATRDDSIVGQSLASNSDDRSSDYVDKYATFRLSADLSHLSNDQRKILPLLIEAADAMDDMFWLQAYGDKDKLLSSISDPVLRKFAEINYGPWDRLDGNRPFLEGVGEKYAGAQFYPVGMTKEEFEAASANDPEMASLYTVVRRNEDGDLVAVPYHVEYAAQVNKAADLLWQAAQLAKDPGFKRYLELRADALRTSDYRESDMAWMDMKNNDIDVVIGPIEVYEDELFGYKAGAEAYILIKDKEWSGRLARYASLLPSLQRGLPVDEQYKRENPGSNSELNAYDAIYYSGHGNAGSKTIAINLPNDEVVQAAKGSRRLQLKNTMRAKFDKILVPIADVLITADQRENITFDAFFANTMLHEVAHGIGIKNTIDGSGTVRVALKEHYSALEEGKADILGLYMAGTLIERGEMRADLQDHYATFLAGIFRSVRFGASSAHGKANMIRFNFFKEMEAFVRDESTGTYRADFDKMKEATDALTRRILELQGNGDYEAAAAFVESYAIVDSVLQADLDRLGRAGIPVDIVFEQGMAELP
jgi:hypothetical protein